MLTPVNIYMVYLKIMSGFYKLLHVVLDLFSKNRYTIKSITLDKISDVMEFMGKIASENESQFNSWRTTRYMLVNNFNWALKSPVNLSMIAMNEKEIIGYLVMYTFTDPNEYTFIEKIVVLHNHQRHGIGSALLNIVIKNSKKYKISLIKLVVEKHNVIAIDWYEKRGFKRTDERLDGYLYQLQI